MDFTQPKHNFFAQALAFNVGDLISIVIISSTLDVIQ
jgi:flagellar basal body L-ring protein FlgH